MTRIGISIILTVVIITIGTRQAEALRCYSCSYTSTSGDDKCVTDPESLGGQNIISCSKKYCTITRQELKDPKGKVASFIRDCIETPNFLNDVLEDDVYISYYRSCTSDLCNQGTGLTSTTAFGSDSGAGENLLVPGLPGNAVSITSNFGMMLFLIIALKIFV